MLCWGGAARILSESLSRACEASKCRTQGEGLVLACRLRGEIWVRGRGEDVSLSPPLKALHFR